jgi:hypothetical protein
MSRRTNSTRTRWDPAAAGPVAWLVGPWDEGEFALALDGMRLPQDSRRLATLDAAWAAAAAAKRPPEVLWLAQPRPGFWPQADVDRLQRAAPLARLVIVAGAWCEGELRTGRKLSGVHRIFWHELPRFWNHSIARWGAGLAPRWSQPLTAAEPHLEPDPRAADAPLHRASCGAPRTVAIDAIDFATFEALAAALAPCGWSAVWTPRGRGALGNAAAGVWDGAQLDPAEVATLAAFAARFDGRPVPVVALVDFPRPEHLALLREAGAAALLGKPYALEALLDALPPTAAAPATPPAVPSSSA